MPSNTKAEDDDGLLRELNWIHSASVIIGTMLGAGIFVVTASAADAMGPAVVLGFMAGIPIIVTTALVYSIFMSGPLGEHPGGAYVHISRTWDSLFGGYIFMWLKWVSFIGALAVLSTGFGQAMRVFEPLAFLSVQNWALVWLTIFFVLNLSGVDVFGNTQAVMTIILVAILLLLGVPGLLFVDLGNFSPMFPNEIYSGGFVAPILTGMSALMFSYIGFESLAQTAGETENPRETLPRVFGYSTVFVGFLYTVVTIVVIGVLGWQGAANSSTPLTAAAQQYFPIGTAALVTFGSMLAYATSLNSTFMVPSRILYAFGDDRAVPELLTHVNERFNTPDIGLTITWILSVFILVTGTFEFALLISLAALFTLYVAHSFSALALPWVRPELWEKCDFQVSKPTLVVITLVSITSMAVFAWQTLSLGSLGPAISQVMSGEVVAGLTSSPALLIIVWAIIGTLIFVGYRWYLRSQDVDIDDDYILRRLYEADEYEAPATDD